MTVCKSDGRISDLDSAVGVYGHYVVFSVVGGYGFFDYEPGGFD